MQLILEPDEAWSVMTLVIAQVLDGVELSEKAQTGVRKWRSDRTDDSEPMHELAEAMNEALGTVLDERTKKLIRRKGRFVSSLEPR